MTTPEPKDYKVPAGAMRPGDLGKLQNINGDSINWGQLTGITAAAEEARNGFLQGLKSSIISPLVKAFTGSEGDLPDLTTAITDQQSKTQSLWDERGRGHVFSSKNLTYRGDQTAGTRMQIPFTEQVGPLIGVEIDTDGGLVLKTPGSWLITAKCGVSGTNALGGDWQRVWLEAYRADGSLLAESWATGWAAKDQATVMDILPLVISPYEAQDGVTIRVFQDAGRWRYLLGGHGYTFLLAQKQSSTRVMSSVDPGDPGVFDQEEGES
ncbi:MULTISPECIES: hypothetical protein [Corynebacterium]|uniref:hypothetical protein n=1 Tax=Corynebacterium sp. HMSC064E07 TaxID=1739545 RepID=UPI0008BEFA3E|nr:hypothetical protein [Corynebacterium sp. HMSC064E07]OFO26070.1 hypothetical protein HMPREF3053_01905 [Corynebacterium sp. HMSC064E07]